MDEEGQRERHTWDGSHLVLILTWGNCRFAAPGIVEALPGESCHLIQFSKNNFGFQSEVLIIDNIFKKKKKKTFFSEGINVEKPGNVPENTGRGVEVCSFEFMTTQLCSIGDHSTVVKFKKPGLCSHYCSFSC